LDLTEVTNFVKGEEALKRDLAIKRIATGKFDRSADQQHPNV
jgi:hypothetical protein